MSKQRSQTQTPDEHGLPANPDAERYILSSILTDENGYDKCASLLEADDFSLEKHRRLFRRMGTLHERGEKIDTVTLANELTRFGELESVDGISYLVSLDEGMPSIAHPESWMRTVKDHAIRRRLIFTSQELINRAIAGDDSTENLVTSAHSKFLDIQPQQHTLRSGFSTVTDIANSATGGINVFLDPSLAPRGIATGFYRLDEMTNGLHPGELFILAARPSVGKTALALNICTYVARTQPEAGAVAVFSLEMSKEQITHRILCSHARVDSNRFRKGMLNQDERNRIRVAFDEIRSWPLAINDRGALSLATVYTELRRLKAEYGLSLAMIDYLQLMDTPKSDSRAVALGQVSRGLKLMAKDLGVPMLVLSQLNRAPELRKGLQRPILSDLRESGAIEQDADTVAFIFREELYRRDREDLRGVAELLLSKQRNGPIGKVDLVFLNHLTKFENRVEDMPQETGNLYGAQHYTEKD